MLVLYRKYRPKSFSEVVGQEHVVQTLSNALKMDRVAHAYLFTGPHGVGKTTIARLLAKAVNCESSADHEPCNKCESCKEINSDKCLDIIEIDAASNRGIDEIRELRDGIKFSPNKLKYKVFIIDEVHQLTKEAFNALLKTLEEPPSHAIFILATTESHKLPETIISRCQKFDFHKLPLEKIIKRLGNLAKKEKIIVDKEALELIALNANGCIRDAESLLGQIMSMEDKHISVEEARAILGVTDMRAVYNMANYLAVKDTASAVKHINSIFDDGHDLVQFTKSLISYLRKVMILKVDPSLNKLVAAEFTKEQLEKIVEQGNKFEHEGLVRLINLFVNAQNRINSSDLPQLPLELAVVDWGVAKR